MHPPSSVSVPTQAILTAAEMRGAEGAAMAAGTSAWAFMKRAGDAAAECVWRVAAGRGVTVLCGPGNNGGDGYAVAENLRRRGLAVRVIAPQPPRSEPASRARARYLGEVTGDCDGRGQAVLVDALFGLGLTRAPGDEFRNLLEKCRATHSFCAAIDMPSTVAGDTGKVFGSVRPTDLTLAIGAWKPAHWLAPASALMGERRLLDIGLDTARAAWRLSAPPRLDPPAADAHKYTRGMLLVCGGAMPGAGVLAADAAMRAGPGYVKLASAHAHPAVPADLVVDHDDGRALADARARAILIGPGLGRDAAARARVAAVLETRLPAVLDADALHLLDPDSLEGAATARLIVTPHEGELSALAEAFGLAKGPKLATARALADATGMVVLAKGPDTLLVGAGRVLSFPPGSRWLSVAGSGDVLAGAVAGRLAVHGDALRAAEEGVWLHHRAAAALRAPFTAGELSRAIAIAYRSLA